MAMNQVGEILKARRQELNLSLKEVENATSIRMNYLQAIEDGDMSRMISHVYAEGFIKQYAGFLGLNAEELMSAAAEMLPQPQRQHFAYGIGTLEHRNTPGGGVRSMPNFAWIAAFGVVVAAAWYLAKFLEVI